MKTARQFIEDKLVIASHNPGKIRELTSLFKPFFITCESSRSLDLIEPLETGSTYLENALEKAQAASKATGLCALGDDSGIEVDALGGEPGLHTAPYTKKEGGREQVFKKWALCPRIINNPRAHFICVLVLYWPDDHYEYFVGKESGKLSFPPRGNNGHGYDPVFIPDGHIKTIAEMSDAEKNLCSHRFIAFYNLQKACIKPRCR